MVATTLRIISPSSCSQKNHSLNGTLVFTSCPELQRLGRNDVRTRIERGSYYHFSLGSAFRTGIGETDAPSQGEYDFEQDDDSDEVEMITITYGHSKDHRPDLKQAILGMICANRTSIPIYLGAISGNTSDKKSLPEIASVYLDQLSDDEETPILVADSALYGAETIHNLSDNQWVSRVPATINEAKDLLSSMDKADMSPSQREGYFFHETTSSYGDVETTLAGCAIRTAPQGRSSRFPETHSA